MTSGFEKHPLYEYVFESPQESCAFPLIHTHRILVKQRSSGLLQKWCCSLQLLIGSAALLSGLHWLLIALLLILISMRWNGVEQEAVVVMPSLGIQLETVYRSKKVKRLFVPLHRILWPVINEAVTPTTCFTYLALLMRDESRLTLTFLHVRPPLFMLVPIWASVCEALGHPPPKSLLPNRALVPIQCREKEDVYL